MITNFEKTQVCVRAVMGRADFAAAGVDTTALGAWVFINLGFTVGFGVAAQRFKEAGGAVETPKTAGSPSRGGRGGYGSVREP